MRMSISVAAMLATLAIAAAPRAASADEGTALAKEHFRRGTKAYDLGHFLEAAAEYEKAYQAKESPALLYNLGQAYRGAGEAQKAINAYRSFLRNLPDAANRAEVLAFIDVLKKTIETQKQAQERPPTGPLAEPIPSRPIEHVRVEPSATPAPAPVVVANAANPHERATGRKLELVGIGIGAVGIAGVALGATFAGLTASLDHDVNHPAAGAAFDEALVDRAHRYQTLEAVLFAVGGAAVVGGVVLYLVGAKKARPRSVALAPMVAPGAAGLLAKVRY